MATPVAKTKIGDVLSEPVDRDSVEQVIEQVYDSFSSFDQAHSYVAQLEEQVQEAADDADRDLIENVGVLHFVVGDYEKAAKRLETVKTRKRAAHFLGRTYLKLDRPADAIDMLEKGRHDDADQKTDVLLVEAFCTLRDAEGARKATKRLERADAAQHLLSYCKGFIAEATGDYASAMQHYESALDAEPEHAPSLFRLARNCDLNGDDERAVELYQKCVSLRPSHVGALINLGLLHEDHGQYEEAIRCYRRVLAIDPRHKQAQLYLKDAESSLTMYIDVSRSKRLRRMDELFSLPAGASSPEEALQPGAVAAIGAATPQEASQVAAAGPTPEEEQTLNTPVEELDLSTRSRKCMQKLGIRTVGELIQQSEQDLLAVPNFGATSIQEVKERLAELGLSLEEE